MGSKAPVFLMAHRNYALDLFPFLLTRPTIPSLRSFVPASPLHYLQSQGRALFSVTYPDVPLSDPRFSVFFSPLLLRRKPPSYPPRGPPLLCCYYVFSAERVGCNLYFPSRPCPMCWGFSLFALRQGQGNRRWERHPV